MSMDTPKGSKKTAGSNKNKATSTGVGKRNLLKNCPIQEMNVADMSALLLYCTDVTRFQWSSNHTVD